MCLIAIAHNATASFPLILAANRDEDYDRATHDAHFWSDTPNILGGRDAVHGGSWLAITRSGRFAAVTNLRGAERRTRSRGELVREFGTTDIAPRAFAESIARHAEEYAGFHLLVGAAGEEVLHITPESWSVLPPGIHAVSNAPLGEEWRKTTTAVEAMKDVVRNEDADAILDELMQFLREPRGTASVESEVFIAGERYGTRASTVIVAGEAEIAFAEQTFTRGGVPVGTMRLFRFER
jgi:uncharacterized protein with NRDE domain